jgi:UDP-N-acetyl-D-mannosaminuronic acid dehydrogenase
MSTELATAFLSSVFGHELVHPSTARVAEIAKLAENAFRDVNVAFANELSKVCKSLGIDVNEVIALANLHPRVDILRPGIGVGGYCIPKDGWFLVESVRGDLIQPKLIPAAREVNDSMPAHVFEIIREMGLEGYSLKSEVGLIGLSFKPNVSDTRNSPSVELVRLLISAGMDVTAYDPYTEKDFGTKRAESLENLINTCHVIILSVGHDEVVEELHNLDLSEKVLLDPGNSAPELKSRVKRYIGLSA